VVDETGMPKNTKPTKSASSSIAIATARTPSAAFARVLPEIQALAASEILRTNLGMERAARRGLAVAERLRPLLPELWGLPGLDAHAVEAMPEYALAVLHAHDLATEAGGAKRTQLTTLFQEAVPLREIMLCGAELLALTGYVSFERVAAIRSGQGHVDTVDDVQALGRLYLELWDRVHDKVPVTRAMVERALTLSAALHRLLGAQELVEDDPLVEPSDPVHLRAKAFTLFLRAYEECRRGVTYLRWNYRDASAIVPSLYPRRSRRTPELEEAEGAANDGLDEAANGPIEASDGTSNGASDGASPGASHGEDPAPAHEPTSETLHLVDPSAAVSASA
jgi:hypothetical protein